MKSIVLFFLYFYSIVSLIGQKTIDLSLLKADLAQYIGAYTSGDSKAMASLIHPVVSDMAGGQDIIASQLEEEKNMYHQLNLRLVDMSTGIPSPVVTAGAEWHLVIPYKASYESAGSLYDESGYFLAASQDEGQSWYFLDLKQYSTESLKTFLPYYNEALEQYMNRPD